MIKEKIRRINLFLQTKIPINYLYFGFVFVYIAFLHAYHIIIIHPSVGHLKKVFLFHSFFQSFLEVSGLLLIYSLIRESKKTIRLLFVLTVTLLLLIHGLDFLLVRIMGLTFWDGLELMLGESWENFIELLYATHVTVFTWVLSVMALAGWIFIGYFFYEITRHLCKQKPFFLQIKFFLSIFCIFPLLIFSFEGFVRAKNLSFTIHREYQKALPWKNTFYSRKKEKFFIKAALNSHINEKDFQKSLQEISFIKNKPDLFFFVVESLRSDFITQQVTPNLFAFKQEGISTKVTLANTNSTQTSWFSLFYSKLPFYFSYMQPPSWNGGGPSLRFLKKLGYDIHVFSSVRLSFYQMDKRIFGADKSLANSFHIFPPDDTVQAYECDQKTMQELTNYLERNPQRGGRCFIIFLESTHFDYSWPKDSDSFFSPFAKKVNYLKIAFKKSGLEEVINRYLNAMHYVDRLFGEFVQFLQKATIFPSSILVVTGDHGEEFYERGHLFHASSLNTQQTHVPIIFKFPSVFPKEITLNKMSSHIDIFPTIFDYLIGENSTISAFFDGESIFKENKWPYSFIARYNAARNPYEFVLHDGKYKLLLQFNNKKEIFLSNALFLLDVQTEKDEPFFGSLSPLYEHFIPVLQKFSLGTHSLPTSLSQ